MNVENQYLELLKTVMLTGRDRKNRTGVKTRMIHGAVLRHNCDQGFPLLTSKKVNFRAVAAELCWFLSGSTDYRELDKLNPSGPNIWKANAVDWAGKLESLGMARPGEGDCGKIYGANWRNFGDHVYKDDFLEKIRFGYDQIVNLVNDIVNIPDSRRLLFTGWDPIIHNSDYDACLPPCHLLCQFDVDDNDMKLNASVYMRSADLFLGVPFNIASYALLLDVMCSVVNSYSAFSGKRYEPGMLVFYIHDAHIYHNHFEQVKLQLSREGDLYDFPRLVNIIDNVNKGTDIFDEPHLLMGCLGIENYDHHPYIKAEMAV